MDKRDKLPDGVLPLDAHQTGRTYGVPTPIAYFTNPSTSGETAYVIREDDDNGVPIPVHTGQVYTYPIEGAATPSLGVYKVPDFGTLYLGEKDFLPDSRLTNLLIRIGFDHGYKDANWIQERQAANDMKWVRLYNIIR